MVENEQYKTDMAWIKRDLEDIKKGINSISRKIDNHEKRISHLEGANKIWIPSFLSLLSLFVGLFIGHLHL